MWSISCTHNPSLLETVCDVEIQFPSRFRNAILQLPDKMQTGKSYYYILNLILRMYPKPDFIIQRVTFRPLYLGSLYNKVVFIYLQSPEAGQTFQHRTGVQSAGSILPAKQSHALSRPTDKRKLFRPVWRHITSGNQFSRTISLVGEVCLKEICIVLENDTIPIGNTHCRLKKKQGTAD